MKFSNLTMPSRILFSAKIVKGREQRPMKKNFKLDYAAPHPIFCKNSERQGAETDENEIFELDYAEPHPIFCKNSERRRICGV